MSINNNINVSTEMGYIHKVNSYINLKTPLIFRVLILSMSGGMYSLKSFCQNLVLVQIPGQGVKLLGCVSLIVLIALQ